MSVLFTIAVLAVVAMSGMAVYGRLLRLRNHVKIAWKQLEPDPSNAAARNVYNESVTRYNDALEAFPANVVAGVAGFHPAKLFDMKAEG